MLTETDVHYLTGILIMASYPVDVDIELGDMVYDIAGKRNRDIDITVTAKDSAGVLSAFSGIEVKDENRPLDATRVEQLCRKMQDMPSITHRAIVSASGYSKTAINKAAYHKTDLFHLIDWELPLPNFEHLHSDVAFTLTNSQYRWSDGTRLRFTCDPPLTLEESEVIKSNCAVCDAAGKPIPLHPDMNQFSRKILENCFQHAKPENLQAIPSGVSTEIDFNLDFDTYIYVRLNDCLRRIVNVQIIGELTKTVVPVDTKMKVLLKIGESVPHCGCAVGILPDGRLKAFSFSNSTKEIGITIITLENRLLNRIYRRTLKKGQV